MGPANAAKLLSELFDLINFIGNVDTKHKPFALDASILIYNILLGGDSGTYIIPEFDRDPTVEPTYFKMAVKKKLVWLLTQVSLLVIFDGSRNPLKQNTNVNRQSGREKKAVELKDLKLNLSADPKLLAKLRKGVAAPNESYYAVFKDVCDDLNIPYVCAAMEADAQAVKLELDGLVEGVITTDGDLFIHGSKQVIFMKSWKGDGECRVVTRDKALLGLGKMFGLNRALTEDECALWGAAQGCDFCGNYMDKRKKDEENSDEVQGEKWLFKNKAVLLSKYDDLRRAYYYFKHAPVSRSVFGVCRRGCQNTCKRWR
jgi:hypothetical protein